MVMLFGQNIVKAGGIFHFTNYKGVSTLALYASTKLYQPDGMLN